MDRRPWPTPVAVALAAIVLLSLVTVDQSDQKGAAAAQWVA